MLVFVYCPCLFMKQIAYTNQNFAKMCHPLKNEYTLFYSFCGSFDPVSSERLRSRVFPASDIPLASSLNDYCQNGGDSRVT